VRGQSSNWLSYRDVVDIQKAFFGSDPIMTQSLEKAIESINVAIALFREKHLPVICVRHMDQENKLVPGEEGFELPDHLNIRDSDLHIRKTCRNSFNKTMPKAKPGPVRGFRAIRSTSVQQSVVGLQRPARQPLQR
jgi:hypothetical protein